MDWILYVLIGITIFEIWRNFRDVHFSLSDLSPKNLLDEPYVIFLILLGLIVYLMGIIQFRIFLAWGITIYCAFCYFKSEKENMQKKEMGFFKKITEYFFLLVLTAIIGLFVFAFVSLLFKI